MRAMALSSRRIVLSALMAGLPPLGLGEHGLQLRYAEREALRPVGRRRRGCLRLPERRRAHVQVEALVHLANGGALGLRVHVCVDVQGSFT